MKSMNKVLPTYNLSDRSIASSPVLNNRAINEKVHKGS